ncbi:receptor-like protein 9b [Gossypium arboreum]|uniref:receptor-like protein 9b n=1 Tax=Gossypium arboreum TaxID=29729 RepID=UPI000819709D|nr:receptor-like protein 9b [Gossypium arboreum]
MDLLLVWASFASWASFYKSWVILWAAAYLAVSNWRIIRQIVQMETRFSDTQDASCLKNQHSSSFMTTVEPNKYVFKIEFLTKNCLLYYKGNILNYMSGLDLSCNNLTGQIPQSLGKLFAIHALNLSHNHLTGFIPVSLSNLSQVGSLDFSYNKLSGKIPSELVNLNFLEVFSVAHNN